MSKEVWEQHEFLYHYTTRAGLEGILSAQSLHATHFRYLNDRNEMFQLRPMLIETVRPSVRNVLERLISRSDAAKEKTAQLGGLDSASASEAEKLINTLYQVSFGDQRTIKYFRPYIISFCGHKTDYERENGLLSQWRAYSGNAGFAIVFRAKPLCDLFFKEVESHAYSAVHIGDVVYDGNIKELQSEFGELLTALENLYPKIIHGNGPAIEELFAPFVSCTSRFKHRGFSEESEVRAVLSPMSAEWFQAIEKENPEEYNKLIRKPLKVVKFKQGLVPYLDIESPKGEILPIERIIIGPSLVAENTKMKLETFLELRGLSIDVLISQTPLC